MKLKIFLIGYIVFYIPTITVASDYKVEVFKENYKETLISGGGELKLYHTLQVKTIYGNKLLILVGKDHEYRKWLRSYLKKQSLYLIKIPDQGDNKFEKEIAVPINIQQIHPVWEEQWNCEGCRNDIIDEKKY